MAEATLGFAGPDQMSSPNQPAIIGPTPDPSYCYTWVSAKQGDPAIAGKIHDAQISIHLATTTTYTLTRQLKDKSDATAQIESDNVTVYVFAIEYFRYSVEKPWKVVVGAPIEFSTTAMPGCTDWQWKLGSGNEWVLQNAANQIGADMLIPYTDLLRAYQAPEMWFGYTYGTVTVSCKDPTGKTHTISSDKAGLRVQVFYDPFKNIAGGEPNNQMPPCWFLLGKKYELVQGFNDPKIEYLHELPVNDPYVENGTIKIDDYGRYNPTNGVITLFPRAGTINDGPLKVFNPFQFKLIDVGGDGKRLHCLAQVLAHEMYHRYIDNIKAYPGHTHSDSDGIDDNDELTPRKDNVYGVLIFDDGTGHSIFPPSFSDKPDTYGLRFWFEKFNKGYEKYGDQELRARIMERANYLETYPDKDWSTDTENPTSNWMKDPPII